ncbi:chlorohydrolase family protein [Arthrobacter sp. MI7-26]|uniref:chlorohydrolase family protein n=1 Tax=Arthrobacter sp. MI7-26 TaxID=2993653 RepID=UPI0022489DC8|nr:chlorohydrolase family protein [Arthrobacter sp. MI7-26]MCX2750461.1 chlorohydrolase family protein [Arthrobacter sp. MI7-26]
MRTRVTAAYVLGHRQGRHVMLHNAEVVYEGDRVVFVGHGGGQSVDTTIDLGESLVMPGLIDLDALTDIDHMLLDSWGSPDQLDGLLWSESYFQDRRRDVFSFEERLELREYALVQLALHGVTTYMPIADETHSAWAETYEELASVADLSRGLGLRAYLGPSYRSGVNVIRADGVQEVRFNEDLGRASLADAIRFLDYCAELADPLVNGALLPCRIETLTEEIMRTTAQVSAERGVPVRLHALQSLVELRLVQEQYGESPLQLLHRNGLLNERLLIPHGLYTDRNRLVYGEDRGDLARLAASGASVVHCPLTSLRRGKVLESFGAYLDAGVNICLGTDSFPPDLIRGMDVGVHLAKYVDGRADAAPVERYVEAATLGGAKALRREDLGRLEAGAQADLVAFRLDDLRDGVHDDPIRTLVLNGTARQVIHSVVAGRTVVQDGVVPGIDMRRLRARAQGLFEKMKSAYAERDYRHRTAAELFPATFPEV